MGIRRKGTPEAPEERGKVRLSGEERLIDVCRKLFHDDRVLPLLVDLNPGLGHGALPKGTTVTLPTLAEVQKFASQMGFSLGFDPAKGGGTQAQRNWAKMQGKQASSGEADPLELVAVLHRQGLKPEVAARRLAALVDADALEAFMRSPGEDEAAQAVAAAGRALGSRRRVRSHLKALSAMLTTTQQPAGRRALLEAVTADGAAADGVLSALLTPEAMRQALKDAGNDVSPHLARADQIAAKDAVLRDAEMEAIDADPGQDVLRALVMAAADGVDILTDERLTLLGIDGVLLPWERHAAQIGGLLKKLVEVVDDVDPATISAVDEGRSDPSLPKPWPLAAALLARLGERLDALHAGQLDRGLAALIAAAPAATSDEAALMSAAELAARAAANARVAEAHDGVPERLSQVMLALFDPLRPSAPDSGGEGQRKQRRRSRAEKALLIPRGERPDGALTAKVVDELLALGPALDDKALRRRLRRLPAPVRSGCRELAVLLEEPIPALLRETSPVGRALLVLSVGLDDELGPALGRASGREAALSLLKVHGTRAMTLTVQRYVELAG